MTTPSERVQRLREETAKVTPGPWVWYDLGIRVYGDDARHIARWDPKATEKVLDLLEAVFERNEWDAIAELNVVALAVLDALDPLSDPSEEGK